MSSATTSKRGLDVRYRTIDLVTIATLGVAFGVIFWGWGKLYEPLSGLAIFSFPPSSGLLAGVWLMAGVVGGLIVRKPGAAFATEFLAAAVSTFIVGGTQWGFSVFASGFWQGLGAELTFLLFFYKRSGVVVAALTGLAAATFASVYEWNAYWVDWDWDYKLAYLGFFGISGIVVAGLGGFYLVQALAKAGVLDAFPVGREQVDAALVD
ncbi:energy-coupling factor transport system substrate-specific component [Aeromicrobium panaciterrae]|uniref:Energy-coupling factor transport system substrate-specific component n=1 Tax=Aeromicrobium panaciterrae TaxID=363861 RepID=A0ABU1UJ95_9ACTN|nr:ECF transporter S component [Aeromicrobium panaciterrae]MDR7085237.1 energy-coupling factor transport system substrate-specific component [Aeromicrobium panaciterrae]